MAQTSFDFLHMDNIHSNSNNISNGYDPDIVHQLEKFGYTKTAIITAITQIPNKNDINAVLDHLESSRLKPYTISRSSSTSTTDSISQCRSSLHECSCFLIINNLLEYYTDIASKKNTDLIHLNDIFEYANFSNSDTNYYNFISCFDHIMQQHSDAKVSFTQSLMESINGCKSTSAHINDELNKILIYLEERRQELLPNESKNNSKKALGNALKNISKSALKNIGEMRQKTQNIEVKRKLTKIVKHIRKSKHKNVNEMNVMNTETQQEIIIYLQTVLMKYESRQRMQNDNDSWNKTAFYITLDKCDQQTFDAFLMDSNGKCGRIIVQWLKYIEIYRENVKFDDLCDFCTKLSYTFCHFYVLPKKYSKCVMLLCYRCILRINNVGDIIYELLNMKVTETVHVNIYHREYHNTLKLDRIYRKKVMWMRVLDRKQLGIKDKHWLNNNVSVKIQSKEQRRLSKIGLFAGSDVPYAECINLMGNLEIDTERVNKYIKYKESIDKMKTKEKSKQMRHRLLHINKKKAVVSVSFDYEENNDDDDDESKNSEKEQDVLPFILPHLGLNTLLGATKCIYETAMQYYLKLHPHKNGDNCSYMITQDHLFPITLYCIIQSRLETPNKWIYFIEHILPKDKVSYGQAAFALSGLKAAVSYILTAKPQTFGLSNEIELD